MLLMHKDIPVAELSVAYGRIQDVIKVYDENHMPIGTKTEFFRLRGRLLETWNKMRAIPQERQDLRRIEQILNYSVSEAKFRSMAVSLTDCYWIREAKLPFKLLSPSINLSISLSTVAQILIKTRLYPNTFAIHASLTYSSIFAFL